MLWPPKHGPTRCAQNIGLKLLQQRAKDDPGVEKFLDYFYKFCMDILFKPFQDIPEFKDYTGTCVSCMRMRHARSRCA